MALMKLCGCGKKIDYTYKHCDKCAIAIEKEKKERVKRYDEEVRYSKENKRYADFYHSSTWITLSEVVKLNYFGLCCVCAVENTNVDEIAESDLTHHIEELKKDWELRLIEDNLVPLCYSCHESIHVNYCDEDKIYLRNVIRKFKDKYI